MIMTMKLFLRMATVMLLMSSVSLFQSVTATHAPALSKEGVKAHCVRFKDGYDFSCDFHGLDQSRVDNVIATVVQNLNVSMDKPTRLRLVTGHGRPWQRLTTVNGRCGNFVISKKDLEAYKTSEWLNSKDATTKSQTGEGLDKLREVCSVSQHDASGNCFCRRERKIANLHVTLKMAAQSARKHIKQKLRSSNRTDEVNVQLETTDTTLNVAWYKFNDGAVVVTVLPKPAWEKMKAVEQHCLKQGKAAYTEALDLQGLTQTVLEDVFAWKQSRLSD